MKIGTLAMGVLLGLGLGAAAMAAAEKQPQMAKAAELLEKAKDHLQKATADKGGHRKKAIELVDQAIGEVKAGIAFDDKK